MTGETRNSSLRGVGGTNHPPPSVISTHRGADQLSTRRRCPTFCEVGTDARRSMDNGALPPRSGIARHALDSPLAEHDRATRMIRTTRGRDGEEDARLSPATAGCASRSRPAHPNLGIGSPHGQEGLDLGLREHTLLCLNLRGHDYLRSVFRQRADGLRDLPLRYVGRQFLRRRSVDGVAREVIGQSESRSSLDTPHAPVNKMRPRIQQPASYSTTLGLVDSCITIPYMPDTGDHARDAIRNFREKKTGHTTSRKVSMWLYRSRCLYWSFRAPAGKRSFRGFQDSSSAWPTSIAGPGPCRNSYGPQGLGCILAR